MSDSALKLTLKGAKIYGFDPTIYKTFENDGKSTKQYSVMLAISLQDKQTIDSYLFNKVSENQDGEFIFYGKSKAEIPVFNAATKERIKEPINEVFLADVVILIDEFTPENGETLRYSKCMAIKYLSKVENEKPKIQAKPLENYEDFFDDGEVIEVEPAPAQTPQQTPQQQGLQPLPKDNLADPQIDDLPFN